MLSFGMKILGRKISRKGVTKMVLVVAMLALLLGGVTPFLSLLIR
jgi:hypothetical protein